MFRKSFATPLLGIFILIAIYLFVNLQTSRPAPPPPNTKTSICPDNKPCRIVVVRSDQSKHHVPIYAFPDWFFDDDS